MSKSASGKIYGHNSEFQRKKGLAEFSLTLLVYCLFGMPRRRIELWTRGFSVEVRVFHKAKNFTY